MIRYRVVGSAELQGFLSHFPPSVKRKVHASLRFIEENPLAGKPLERELTGYRSFPIPPYRVVYRVEPASRIVRIARIGHRDDIYEILIEKINSGEVREKKAVYVYKRSVSAVS